MLSWDSDLRPYFHVLILMLRVVFKIATFPPNNRSFSSALLRGLSLKTNLKLKILKQ